MNFTTGPVPVLLAAYRTATRSFAGTCAAGNTGIVAGPIPPVIYGMSAIGVSLPAAPVPAWIWAFRLTVLLTMIPVRAWLARSPDDVICAHAPKAVMAELAGMAVPVARFGRTTDTFDDTTSVRRAERMAPSS